MPVMLLNLLSPVTVSTFPEAFFAFPQVGPYHDRERSIPDWEVE